ncbi:Zinc finger BED domain-containing protein 5 [Eumeta japonica]|uniref:Zinc finger BED domain-containing protein 5 n=1 Tax=Eumeta variegata TaxID=151549 RepID=A0A4C1VLM7_EUMVA|nr:Zinc finger BED domain-containing protein 5 [Eumeta japonica]
MDESTDVASLAILLVIVRYPYESSFEEDMLMCLPLPTNTTGEEIFTKINIFFEENNLGWNDCIDICTDGGKAMTGFSTYAATKTKYRNRLEAEPDMRLLLSSIKSDINQLMKKKKQFHMTTHQDGDFTL